MAVLPRLLQRRAQLKFQGLLTNSSEHNGLKRHNSPDLVKKQQHEPLGSSSSLAETCNYCNKA
ncbi:hypothetical protein JRQ81_011989 [Phrynocephalus forsythii]|uniref:Uncharacterized protein n=1 Tax=Phrynocephalus forsythii TaxID=171643 RepID=A0A9Q0X6V1_9SAUR|nr:hypothetical protein JRQ81_011989 [Phrynocephalus forsythii]